MTSKNSDKEYHCIRRKVKGHKKPSFPPFCLHLWQIYPGGGIGDVSCFERYGRVGFFAATLASLYFEIPILQKCTHDNSSKPPKDTIAKTKKSRETYLDPICHWPPPMLTILFMRSASDVWLARAELMSSFNEWSGAAREARELELWFPTAAGTRFITREVFFGIRPFSSAYSRNNERKKLSLYLEDQFNRKSKQRMWTRMELRTQKIIDTFVSLSISDN